MLIEPPEVLDRDGADRAWLSLALATIVRAAAHVPKGTPERLALAQAAAPLNAHLFGSSDPR
jgi:hypothetical protein